MSRRTRRRGVLVPVLVVLILLAGATWLSTHLVAAACAATPPDAAAAVEPRAADGLCEFRAAEQLPAAPAAPDVDRLQAPDLALVPASWHVAAAVPPQARPPVSHANPPPEPPPNLPAP
jgi:hypothetical protein